MKIRLFRSLNHTTKRLEKRPMHRNATPIDSTPPPAASAIVAFCVLFSLLFGALAGPAFAGTVYVPWTTSWTSDGVELVTTVRITNESGEALTYTGLFLPDDENGLTVETEPLEKFLAPFTTDVFEGDDLALLAPAGRWGLLEISADAEVHVVAHLRGTGLNGVRLGVDLPVASSKNLTAAGVKSVLQGLSRNADKSLTDLVIVNLSGEEAFCGIEGRQRNGEFEGEAARTLEPLSLHVVPDILGDFEVETGDERSIFVDCDQTTFVFAMRRDLRNGETLVTLAAGSGASTLVPPPRGDDFQCPENTVFERLGVFHTPTPGDEKKKYKVFQPGLEYSRIELTMEFTHGGWDDEDPDGNHAIFWLHRDLETQWAGNVFGYFNAFGPSKNLVRFGTNTTHDISPQPSKSVFLEPGKTYQVNYFYDTAISLARASISENGEELVRINEERTPNTILTGSLGMFLVFGHPAENEGPEEPTYGWSYANLCVTAQ